MLLCTKCGKDCLTEGETGYAVPALTNKVRTEQQMKLDSEMEEVLKSLKERCKRTVLRKIDTGEVTYDPVKKIFVFKDTDEEYKVGEKKGEGNDDDDSDNDDDDSDDDNSDDNENDGDDSDKETQKKDGKIKDTKADKEEIKQS